jgi:hypothetical protein
LTPRHYRDTVLFDDQTKEEVFGREPVMTERTRFARSKVEENVLGGNVVVT